MKIRRYALVSSFAMGLALALPVQAQILPPTPFPVVPKSGFPATIAVSGSWNSGIVSISGYAGISAAVTSTQTGVISIQRYVDAAGLIPIGTPIVQAISASTLATVSVNDGLPAGYFQVTITNTGGSTATVTTPAIIMTGL